MSYNLWHLCRVLIDKQTTIEWLQKNGLLPMCRKCPECSNPMKLTFGEEGKLGTFRCAKKHAEGLDVTKALSENTWFENSNLDPAIVMIITYCFATEMTHEQAVRESSIDHQSTSTCSSAVSEWYSYCRQVCMITLEKKFEEIGKIGGPGRVVEVDQYKIGKIKCDVSEVAKEGQWVVGMIDVPALEEDDDVGNFRMEVFPDDKRDAETLLEIINKHVQPGTTIVTDCWEGYEGLDAAGFEHLTVDHACNFVDPATGAHTQTILGNWRHVKKRVTRAGIRNESLTEHLCEYLWRRNVQLEGEDVFDAFLKDIKSVYPGRQ